MAMTLCKLGSKSHTQETFLENTSENIQKIQQQRLALYIPMWLQSATTK